MKHGKQHGRRRGAVIGGDQADGDQNLELAERLGELGQDCAAHMKEPYLSINHADLLYDERGLPR